MKVVLDTNVLVSGVFWRGPASRILELWAKDKVEVVVSPEILTEYQRLLVEMERDKPAGLADAWTGIWGQPPISRISRDQWLSPISLRVGEVRVFYDVTDAMKGCAPPLLQCSGLSYVSRKEPGGAQPCGTLDSMSENGGTTSS
jgi:hypothetical protein